MTTTRRCQRKRLGWGLFLLILASGGRAQEILSDLPCPDLSNSNNSNDNWQDWDYYRILGLDRNSEATPSQIRKAYRNQAKQWHPDKHTATQNNSTNTSYEQANERFARIAQAYDILSDEWKRNEYNLFLQYCERQSPPKQQQEEQKRKWSKLFSNKLRDPLRAFEEFLFGTEDDDSDDLYYSHNYDNVDAENDNWFFDMPPPPQNHATPIRITKHQDIIRDAFGQEMVRLSQTEEYPPSSERSYYYRIVSQDFVQILDPYTGQVSLQPLTKPYLREEGYRTTPSFTSTSSSRSRGGRRKKQPLELPRESLLFPGDVLTPDSALLVSPNKRYYAGLSKDCELLIMANHAFGEDTLVWSSEPQGNVPRRSSEFCFATLRGPHLVVALGRPEIPHQILWYSDATDDMDEGDHDKRHPNYGNFPVPSTYLAQLDNDGSLVVYKVWVPPVPYEQLSLSARALWMTQHFWKGITRDEHYDQLFVDQEANRQNYPGHFSNFEQSSKAMTTYKRCVYATGPSGCFRLARRLYQLSMDIFYSIQSLVGKIDAMMDFRMDLVLEEDDYLRVLKESSADFGSHLMTSSARLVRRVLQLVLFKSKTS